MYSTIYLLATNLLLMVLGQQLHQYGLKENIFGLKKEYIILMEQVLSLHQHVSLDKKGILERREKLESKVHKAPKVFKESKVLKEIMENPTIHGLNMLIHLQVV